MNDAIEMKCPKCGLCDSSEPICAISGEELQIFDDDMSEADEIVNKSSLRVQVWCSELGDDGFGASFPADVYPDHNIDYLESSCKVYARQIGLDEEEIDWQVLKIGSRWVDAVSYGEFYIGHEFGKCVENLDKAKAGESFGRPLSDWEKD